MAARFRSASGLDGLRRRLGAISETKGILYWSTTQQHWQALILDAHPAKGPDGSLRGTDFSPDEVAAGRTLFFKQADNVFGEVIYRMRIRTLSAERLVFEIENVTPLRYLTIPLFGAGQVQSISFIEREAPGVWRYYALSRSSGKAAGLIAGYESSAINRAVAFYRHLAGIPTDQEPPAAR